MTAALAEARHGYYSAAEIEKAILEVWDGSEELEEWLKVLLARLSSKEQHD